MIKLKCIPHNVGRNIVGRISHKPAAYFRRKDIVFVSDILPDSVAGYAAVVISRKINVSLGKISTPLCHNIDKTDILKDGDIVLINPVGLITVLYQINSQQNAILATEQCNFSCIMCPQDITKETDNITPLNLKTISLINRKTSNIAITGGEPTLIGDDLIAILEHCKRFLPETSITILTNGMKLSNFDFVKRIAMVYNKSLTFAIPLYADTDTGHDGIVKAKSFYKIIEGLYNLALFNFKVEIRTLMTALNYRRLPMLAEFIYHNLPFVSHVAIMGMETRGLARDNITKLWIDPYDCVDEINRAVTYFSQRWLDVSIYNYQLCVLPKELRPYARKSISVWKNIFLDPCKACNMREKCCGFFTSSEDIHSQHIEAIKN